jgi:hypothetical protein
MGAMIGKLLALLIASAVVVVAVIMHGTVDSGIGAFVLVLLACVALIWFGDVLGEYVGPIGDFRHINRQSPGGCLAALGWIGLIGLALAWIWFRLRAP